MISLRRGERSVHIIRQSGVVMVETSSPPTGLVLKRCPSSPIVETQLHPHSQHQLRQQHLSGGSGNGNFYAFSGGSNSNFSNSNSNNNNNSTAHYSSSSNMSISNHPPAANMPANCQRPPTPPSPSSTYHLTTAMLLNSQQCGYLGQRLQSVLQQQMQSQTPTSSDDGSLSGATILEDERSTQASNTNAAVAAAASLFTIDSILGSRSVSNAVPVKGHTPHTNPPANAVSGEGVGPGGNNNSQQKRAESPASLSSNSSSTATSPLRPQRAVPPAAVLQHPGLHLGHLAAAAATGFAASPSDFLGKSNKCVESRRKQIALQPFQE